ncbi:MAG: NAD(+) synthase [Planctomycetota bacterium]
MKLIKVAAGVLNQTPLDWEGNRNNIVEAIRLAREQNVTVLCLPELCITGYGCEDAFHSPGLHDTALEILESIIPETKGMIVSVGLPLMYAGGLFNTSGLFVDGNVCGFVAKQHLAGDGIHYEPRWFKPWPEKVDGEIDLGGKTCPLGDILFDVGGIRIGFEVCEDAWVGNRPGGHHAARGADIILNPSASHFAFGKRDVRERFVIEGSRAFNVTYIYSNLNGNESGRAIFDGDAMIAADGKMLAVGNRLSFKPYSLTTATIDVDSTRMSRSRTGSFEPDLDGDESDIIRLPFEFPDCEVEHSAPVETVWETGDTVKHEEFTRAVSLGLFDYMRKSRSRGFVLSLSGGADSAACAVLVASMCRLAADELGLGDACKRMGGFLSEQQPENEKQLVNRLLTTVYQATRNSGEVTRNAARDVATATGARHLEFDVDSLVNDYTTMVSEGVGYRLNWDEHDLALQNIQARVRAPGVWMLANLQNALLISTSNRSEAAVGYATMDGDTSGGIAPIAGIDKAYLRRWLVWMEKEGPDGLGAISGLKSINAQQPTAELRPPDQEQTDEGDLMPYEILDFIERKAIRDKLMPVEVFEHAIVEYRDESPDQLGAWVIRFFQLFCRNQWKRERYAPSFHLDDESLDPKSWCRFPILSGGYRYEIQKLKTLLESDG